MSDEVARLRRWEESGGRWRVLARTGDSAVVALLTCDAGEEVDRLTAEDPALLGYLGDRETSDENPANDDAPGVTPPDDAPDDASGGDASGGDAPGDGLADDSLGDDPAGDSLSDDPADDAPGDDPAGDSPSDDLPAAVEERAGRDRDLTGRPRNSRPRDALGRPLKLGAAGVPTMPDDLDPSPADGLRQAQKLLDDGFPFHAHEVLEAVWKSAPAGERELWRGLAQLAVGLTHARRGNTTGAARLLRRSADRIAAYESSPPHGLAVAELVAWARATAADVDAGDPGAADRTPRLATSG